jgi:hypothetical protein
LMMQTGPTCHTEMGARFGLESISNLGHGILQAGPGIGSRGQTYGPPEMPKLNPVSHRTGPRPPEPMTSTRRAGRPVTFFFYYRNRPVGRFTTGAATNSDARPRLPFPVPFPPAAVRPRTHHHHLRSPPRRDARSGARSIPRRRARARLAAVAT